MHSRRSTPKAGAGMSSTTEISFDAPTIMWSLGTIMLFVLAVLACAAWRRSGFDRAVGGLELLRLVIAVMAFVTLLQPEWKEIYEPAELPVLAVLRDTSISMDTRDVIDRNNPGHEPVSRLNWMNQQLEAVSWDALAGSVEVVQQTFGSGLLSEDVRLATNIDAVLEDSRAQYDNLRAVVLVSDGDWNQGESPANAATRLRVNQVPVYAVTVGSDEPLPDIEVSALEPPTFSVVGKSLQVPFNLRSTVATDYETEVVLSVETGVQLTKRVVVPAMGQVRDVFFWTPDEVGDIELELSVPIHPEERRRENNRARVAVAIKAESLKVLVVESLPRWEYRYLRNALERDPGVEVSCLLFHPGLSKRGGGSGYLEQFPQTDEELATYDVIFLGDVGVSSDQLTPKDCARIKGLIESQASGLIFMPGMRGYQYSLLDTPLKDLFPVVLDDQTRRGFGSQIASSPVLTDVGQASLLTKLADTVSDNLALWRSLPGFQWRSPAIRARAGCEVLAIHEQSRAPLLVTKTYGTGKVLFMGTDSAWRWREGVEDKHHYRFWGQVARWMAYQRHMAEGELLRVFYSPDRPTAGNSLTLNATVLDPSGAPLSDGTVTADLVDPHGGRRKLQFQAHGADWGLYTARFSPRHVGVYQLALHCQETAAVLEAGIEVQGQQQETKGKPARPEVLQEIANISRGEALDAQQMDRLCELVLQLPAPEPSIRRKQIWASPVWAGTLILGMGVFWVGRKMLGAI